MRFETCQQVVVVPRFDALDGFKTVILSGKIA